MTRLLRPFRARKDEVQSRARKDIVLYFIFLLCLAPFNLLSFDTYYYWEWSRHLALSYYDGSPMIAYWIKASTWVFGDTLFALSFLGVLTTACSGYVLYRTARLFLQKEASLVATTLWLFAPLTTLTLLKQTTYDAPLIFFWALTLYFAIRTVIDYSSGLPRGFAPRKDGGAAALLMTGVGLSAGLLLLSKYSGIVLLLGLLLFLLTTPYRKLFTSLYFYVSLILALLVFSPVLWWNAQHHFISFTYQLQTHQVQKVIHPLLHSLIALITIFIPTLNFLLIPLFFRISGLPRLLTQPRNDIVSLCTTLSFTCLGFYLIASLFAEIRPYWLAPYLLTATLLAGVMYESMEKYRKPLQTLAILYLIVSVGILLANTTLFTIKKRQAFTNYQLLQQFNKKYPAFYAPVVSAGWLNARMFFFLKNHPPVYTLPCGWPENQYQLWRKPLQEAFYLDILNNLTCIKKYFKVCEHQDTVMYQAAALQMYHCYN